MKLSNLFCGVLFVQIFFGCAGEKIGAKAPPEKLQTLTRKTISYRLPERKEPASLSYLIAGDPEGRRIIFIHGTPGSAMGWGDYLLDVPPGFEYVSVDRPGFGKSDPEGPVTSFQTQVKAMAPLFEGNESGKKVILVGHSLGGALVPLAMLLYPEKIDAGIIAAGALDPDLEKVLWIQRVGQFIDFFLPRSLKNANEELIAYESELRLFTSRLSEIQQPILIIHGTKDDLVPYENVDFMLKNFTGSSSVEVVRLEGISHFLPWNSEKAIRQGVQKITQTVNQSETLPE